MTGEERATGHMAAQPNLWLAGRRLAVIDVGSNSIRLLAVELVDERTWHPIAQERAMTRLAHGLDERGVLLPEAMAQSVEAIGRFREVAERMGAVRTRAFATAAVREAKNRDDFVSLVRERTGVKLEIVSAREEGRLTHRSAARVFDLSRGTAAVVDIGGGSMEVVISRNGVITENSSMPLGAVLLTEHFGGPEAASGPEYKKMRTYVERQIRRRVRELDKPPTIVVGCGGTCTTLLTLAAAARGMMIDRNSPALASLGPVPRAQLRTILDDLRALTLEQRLRVPGLPSDRADIAVAGLTAVERLLTHLGADSIAVHPGGFREGLILSLIDQEIAARKGRKSDTPDGAMVEAARTFAERCGYEHAHCEHVAKLALSLYDQLLGTPLVPALGTTAHERAILESAALLHDVGTMVEYKRHHKHTQTIVLHADLPGWSPRQVEVLAQVARYHRRAAPKAGHRAFAALTLPEQAVVRRLAGILRVADGLDRSHRQAVRSVNVRPAGESVTLGVDSAEAVPTDIEGTREKSDLLAAVLGRSVQVIPATDVQV
jgi:exopolyphosphatase/guanosine-5'-triphosphate,3'-diphosphate pyrophosphatase